MPQVGSFSEDAKKNASAKSEAYIEHGKAAGRIRTDDLRFTKASLCQLSYSGQLVLRQTLASIVLVPKVHRRRRN